MKALSPSLELLRVLAGEGDFHIYRLLQSGQRVFLFSKCLLTTFAYFKGKGSVASSRVVTYVKGANQLRYHKHVFEQLEAELGPIEMFVSTSFPGRTPEKSLLPRMLTSAVCRQVCYLLMMLMTGKRRYLNLYLLDFACSIEKAVDSGMCDVEAFVCFNDQPYDVAAIVRALNRRKDCRTIVIQHGLILSEKFYFPSVANEFWAWGELSRKHYRAWDSTARLIVKGRYRDDMKNKQERFVLPFLDRPIRILVAPSFFHDEVKSILTNLDKTVIQECKQKCFFGIKFHPATKLIYILRRWCNKCDPWLCEEYEPMEKLVEKYDVLVTKNSTSAVDFLLNGKPVFFTDLFYDERFPSADYGFLLEQMKKSIFLDSMELDKKNQARQIFLKLALNV